MTWKYLRIDALVFSASRMHAGYEDFKIPIIPRLTQKIRLCKTLLKDVNNSGFKCNEGHKESLK